MNTNEINWWLKLEATDEQAAWDKAREESNGEDVTDDTTEEMQLYSCELVAEPTELKAVAELGWA